MFLYRFNIEKMLEKSDKNVCVMNTDVIRGYLSSYQEVNRTDYFLRANENERSRTL